jgi:DNA-binding NarL/FixJ family response regulator
MAQGLVRREKCANLKLRARRNKQMTTKIRVTILEDHQPTVDGYRYRLDQVSGIEIAAAITYGLALEATLAEQATDVLLLDINVPMSADNPNPYPIFDLIARLKDRFPQLIILVISMHSERTLIKSIMEMGVNGYILKDDHKAIKNLGSIIYSVAQGGTYLSHEVNELLFKQPAEGAFLSPRQLQILSMCAANPELTTMGIAHELHIAPSTVRNLLSSAYARLNVPNRIAAIAKARQMGIITPYPQTYQPISATVQE